MDGTPGMRPSAAIGGKGIELCTVCGTVDDAGVLVDQFGGGEEPKLVTQNRPTQRGDVVLAGERLLGIGRGLLNGENAH